jgi:glycosyltransferase involved in cell wall biosynthesis
MKLSIITIAFNAADTIEDAVKSVLSQRCEGFELEYLVIDGASTDATLAVLAPYRESIHLISEPDQGIYDAMNKGIASASGDLIGILNADDLYASDNVLQRVVDLFIRSGSDSVYGDLVYVHRDDPSKVTRTWTSGAFKREAFLHGWMPPHPTFFVRKSVYLAHGVFSLQLRSAADYELMLRFLYQAKISTEYLEDTLVRMRVGGMSNASLSNRWRANREDREAWRLNGLKPKPWTLLLKPLRKVSQFWKHG